ncbi:MAG: DUF99 family protein [Polyangiaceae bacterium]
MNTIGFDDAPFPREHRGDVMVVGVVCAGTRADGIVTTRVRRDGANATDRLASVVANTGFRRHLHAILLQGIAVGGFNVIDVHRLSEAVELPVLVVVRRKPRFHLIEAALTDPGSPVRGGAAKWALIQRAGEVEPLGHVFAQRVNLDKNQALRILEGTILHGHIPEPLRLAHLIAGGVTTGRSRGRT